MMRSISLFKCSGYMSPEYAMQCFFSEKSDVFSFGVLLLEIFSGRKTTCFYDDQQSYLSLVGFVGLFDSLSFFFTAQLSSMLNFYLSHLSSFRHGNYGTMTT